MSVEVKLIFATTAAAAEALAQMNGLTFMSAPATAAPAAATEAKPAKTGKSAPATAAPAAATPTASPASAAPAPIPASSTPAPAVESPDLLPYAPLAERITGAIAASNPNSAANRVALKALFAELAETYGSPVKTGSDIKPADRVKLAAVLDKIAPVAAEEAMS